VDPARSNHFRNRMTLLPRSESTDYADETPVAGRKPWLFTALKVALSAIVIIAVARNVDLEAAWQRFANQNPWFPAAALATMSLQIMIAGLRWHLILRGLGATSRLTTSLRLCYIAVFFNTWLWGSVGGDVLRAWLLQNSQLRLRQSINSVILDRVAAVGAVGILVLVTVPIFVASTHQSILGLVLGAVAGCLLCGIVTAALIQHLPIDWKRFKFLRGVQLLSAATATIFLKFNIALPVLGVAIAGQLITALAVYFMSLGLNVGLSLFDCAILMQPVALAIALPISVGGWGVRETAMIGLLGFVGIPSSAALSLSVQMGLLTIVATLPGGVLWLLHKDQTRS
jgi:glycosyltransferase 2 family protein